MKLIATLATLAALVGQTQAATVAATITATHDEVGLGVCTDKITLKAVIAATVVTASKKVTWKLPDAFKLEGTFASGTHITSIKTEAAVLTDGGSTAADAKYTGLAYNATTNQIEYTLPANKAAGTASAAGDDQEIKLKAVCNYMTTVTSTKYTWTPAGSKVKFSLQTDDTALVTSSETTATPSANEPKELTALKLVEIPTKGATGKVRVEFTADAAAATAGNAGKKIYLNLPTGYKYKAGAKCKVGPKDAPVEFTAAVGTPDTTVPYAEMALGAPTTAIITAAALAFECDQVISTADAPVPFPGDVSLKYGVSATAATYMGYFKSITDSPTAKPTAKAAAADSPASVATASGVVVGALGVAALFLA